MRGGILHGKAGTEGDRLGGSISFGGGDVVPAGFEGVCGSGIETQSSSAPGSSWAERASKRYEHVDGYNYEAFIKRVLIGLGFEEAVWDKTAEHFSGGQKTRMMLAAALVRQPDFLILDEPTNHLDIAFEGSQMPAFHFQYPCSDIIKKRTVMTDYL